MKKKLGTMMFIMLSFFLHAQVNTFNIYGKIIDHQTKEPIAAVTVETKTQTAISKSDGIFRFNNLFEKGNYSLKISCVGYKKITKDLFVENKSVDVIVELEKQEFNLLDLEVISIRSTDNAPFTKTNLEKK